MRLREDEENLQGLLDRCRREDSQAWSSLVMRFQSLVYSVARRYRLNEDDAADVFQTTFAALFRSIDRIEDGRSLPRWLAVTASRESLRAIRISGKYALAGDESLNLDEVVQAEELGAEANAIQAEKLDQLRTAILRLGGRCPELLTELYSSEEPAYADIAGRVGIPIGAIGPTRGRCLEKLRKKLSEIGWMDD